MRAGLELGVASATLESDADFEISSILNERVIDGSVFMGRSEVAAVYKWNQFQLSLGVDILYLHRSLNTGLSFTFLMPI